MADTKDEKKEDAAPAEAKKDKPAKKGGGAFRFVFFMVIFGAAVPFIMPTLALFMVGMIPTMVALVTDNDRRKSGTAAVGAMNAAGITPFIIDLWVKGQTMENAIQILGNSVSWLVMLGAAGIGWLIVFAVPQAVALLSFANADVRLKVLRKNLESLKESWGPEVGTTKPIDKIENNA